MFVSDDRGRTWQDLLLLMRRDPLPCENALFTRISIVSKWDAKVFIS
jgi:hypothetical protein